MKIKSFLSIAVFTSLISNQIISKDLSTGQMKQKIDFLYDKGWEYLEDNPDSALYFGNVQKELALQVDYELGLVNACYIIGYAHYNKLQFDLAALSFFNGLNFIKEKNDIKFRRKKIFLLQSLGSVYHNTYQYDTSLDYLSKALKIANKLNDKQSLQELYFNIALNYWKKGEYDLANDYYKKCLGVSKEITDKYVIARVYNSLGILNAEREEYQQAKRNYLMAIETGETVDNMEKDMLMFKINLGECYFRQNKFDSAKSIYLEALKGVKVSNDTEKIKWVNNNLGDVYIEEKDFEKAISYYKKSLELKNPDVIDEKAQYAYNKISNAYEALGQYKLALQYKSEYLNETDKVLALKESLSEQNAQYRMKEVEWLLERQQQQSRLLAMQEEKIFWFKVSMSVLFMVFVYVAYKAIRYYRGIRAVKKWLAT